MDHLWYYCLVFVMAWGPLLWKGWPLGSRLWCLNVKLSLSYWHPGSGLVLDCMIPDLCTVSYLGMAKFSKVHCFENSVDQDQKPAGQDPHWTTIDKFKCCMLVSHARTYKFYFNTENISIYSTFIFLKHSINFRHKWHATVHLMEAFLQKSVHLNSNYGTEFFF